MTDRDLARFLAKVDRSGECWQWIAALSTAGYGKFSVRRSVWVNAHRIAYAHFVGPIPEGLDIDHLCRNRACVNPAHLEAVTHRENARRGKRCKASAVFETHTPEQRAKIRAGNIGRVVSHETRQKLSAASSGRWLGKQHAAETREKMAAARRAWWAKKREAA